MKKLISRLKRTILLIILFSSFASVLLTPFFIHSAFASSIFYDGLESGGIANFSGSTVTAPNTLNVSATAKYHGSYGMQMWHGSGSGTNGISAYKFHSTLTEVWIQSLIKIVSFTGGNDENFLTLRNGTGLTPIQWSASFAVKQDASHHVIAGYWNETGTWTSKTSATTGVTLGNWNNVTLYYKAGSGTGQVRLYLNGTEVADVAQTGLNAPMPVDRSYWGMMFQSSAIEVNVYYDDAGTFNSNPITDSPVVLSYGQTSTVAASSSTFYTYWQTYFGEMSIYIFGTNNTGSWVNSSQTSFSVQSNLAWANTTKTLTAQIGVIVQWRVWAKNTMNVWGDSGIKQFVTSTLGGANLKWKSSFESPVSLTDIYSGVAHSIDGNDQGFDWANLNHEFSYIGGESYVTTAIDSFSIPRDSKAPFEAHGGSSLRALYQELRDPPDDIYRNQLQIETDDGTYSGDPTRLTNLPQMYYSSWWWLPSDLDLNAGGWDVLFSWRESGNTGATQGYDYPLASKYDQYSNVFYLYRNSTALYWHVAGVHYLEAGSPFTPYTWQDSNHEIAIPLGQWFHLEIYIERSLTNGVFKAWVNGQSVFDISSSNPPESMPYGVVRTSLGNHQARIFAGKEYSSASAAFGHYPLRHWLDDLQIYDALPTSPTDITPPTYLEIAHNTTVTGQPVKFSIKFQDNVGLSKWLFSWNASASWVNRTLTAFSGNPAWANRTETLPSAGVKVAYRWYTNDTSNNWVVTSVFSFVTTAGGVSITVLLNVPTDGGTFGINQNISFMYTPIFFGVVALENASLWTNEGGVWGPVAWDMGAFNASVNLIYHAMNESGAFIWNIATYTTATHVFAQQNRTLFVLGSTPDTEIPPPDIEIIIGSNNMTFYLRSDSWTTNTITAYCLDEDESTVQTSLTDTSVGVVAVQYGFRSWLVHSGGTLTEVTTGVPYLLTTLTANYTGYKQGIWNAPETRMILGWDAFEVTIYSKLGSGAWTAKASYISEVPIFSKLILHQSWTFNLYVAVSINSTTTTTTYSFGDNSHKSYITGIGLKTPLTQEIQAYYLQKGDLIQWLLYGYTAILGQGVFMGLLLLIGCSTMYVRYRSFAPVLMMFILFGGVGGLVWAFVPSPATFIVWIFLLVGLAVVIFRVMR